MLLAKPKAVVVLLSPPTVPYDAGESARQRRTRADGRRRHAARDARVAVVEHG
jgi:hypothetical protein